MYYLFRVAFGVCSHQDHLLEGAVHHLSLHCGVAQLALASDLSVNLPHCFVPRQLVQFVISEYSLCTEAR